jgi:hypothetical protein
VYRAYMVSTMTKGPPPLRTRTRLLGSGRLSYADVAGLPEVVNHVFVVLVHVSGSCFVCSQASGWTTTVQGVTFTTR